MREGGIEREREGEGEHTARAEESDIGGFRLQRSGTAVSVSVGGAPDFMRSKF